MRVSIATVAVCMLAVSLMPLPAGAQCINPALPIQQLDGTTWAFRTSDLADSAVGIFTAKMVPNGSFTVGRLSITENYFTQYDSENNQATGIYTIDPDCSGGTLVFTGATYALSYRFVFAAGGTQMFLVATNDAVRSNLIGIPGVGDYGKAVKLPGPPTCGGADPLSVFAGKWSFVSHDVLTAENGFLTASVSGNRGLLNVLVNVASGLSSLSGPGLMQQGAYTMSADCSGGTLQLKAGVTGTFAFVFASPNEIFMAGLSTYPGLNFSVGSIGTAVRY